MTNNPQAFPVVAQFDSNGRSFVFKNLKELRSFCINNARCCAPLFTIRWKCMNGKNYREAIAIVKSKSAPYWKFEARNREGKT